MSLPTLQTGLHAPHIPQALKPQSFIKFTIIHGMPIYDYLTKQVKKEAEALNSKINGIQAKRTQLQADIDKLGEDLDCPITAPNTRLRHCNLLSEELALRLDIAKCFANYRKLHSDDVKAKIDNLAKVEAEVKKKMAELNFNMERNLHLQNNDYITAKTALDYARSFNMEPIDANAKAIEALVVQIKAMRTQL